MWVEPRHEWVNASPAASALVRAVLGPTASFTHQDFTAGRAPGRTYLMHVSDEEAPIHALRMSFSEVERLEHLHGLRADAVVAERMLAQELAAPLPDGPKWLPWPWWGSLAEAMRRA